MTRSVSTCMVGFTSLLLALVTPAHLAQAQCGPGFITRLLDSVPDASNGAGTRVAIDGDYAVVSSTGWSQTIGHLTVFHRENGAWTEQAQLRGSDLAPGDIFGSGMAISGDTIVGGAHFHDNRNGCAYVFRRSGTTWTQEAKLVKSGGYPGSVVGASAGISGNTIVLGAPGEGMLYVFERSGTTWTQTASLGSEGGYFSQLGTSVKIDHDTIISGALLPSAYAGGVYVYKRTAGTWAQEAKLTASDATPNAYFGLSLDLDGDTVAIGAFRAGGPGAAYVFTRSDGIWTQQQKLTKSTGTNDYFGYSVAVQGDAMTIGAYGESWPYGVTYFYRQDPSGTWITTDSDRGSSFGNMPYFGYAAAMSGATAVIGAYANGISFGGGFVYDFKRPIITQQPQSLSVSASAEALFSLSAVGTSNLSYRWRRNGVPLDDTGPYLGTSTSTLRIRPASSSENGQLFDCVVSGACDGVSRSATLTVESASCSGDLNNDGFVDDSDFVLFAVAYNVLDCADPSMPSGCPSDFNADAVVDDADFVTFAAAYNEFLCP